MADTPGVVTADLPAGLAGLSQPPRLHADPKTLRTATSISLADDTIRKMPGAARFNATPITGSPFVQATLSLSASWAMAAGSLKTAGVPVATALGTATGTGGGPLVTVSITLGSNVASGVAIVVTAGVLEFGTEVLLTVTDTKGNTYVPISSVANGWTVWMYVALNVTALVIGDKINVQFSSTAAIVNATVLANSYTNIVTTGAIDRTSTAIGTGTAVSSSLPALSQVPELIVGGGSCPGNATATAAGSPVFTKLGDVTTGSTAGDVRTWQEYRYDTGSPTIIGLHDWWPSGTVQRLITASLDGNLYRETSGNIQATTLKSGLSTTARPGRFIQGGQEAPANARKLFYLNGVDTIQVLASDGATTADITGPASSWSANNQPTNGFIHQGRNIVFGVANDPQRVWISRFDNHETFTVTDADVAQLGIRSNIGDRLWGGCSFNGIAWFWKFPRGIFYLDDTDPLVKNWTTRIKSEALGCAASPYAVLPIDDNVLFLSADGRFHLLSAVATLGGVEESDLSRTLWIHKYLRTHLNLARLNQVVSVWYPQLKQAWFGVPWDGSMTNTRLLIFDFALTNDGGPVRFSDSALFSAEALAPRRGTDTVERPIVGEAGFVYLTDQAVRSKGDAGYVASYQLPILDMGHHPKVGAQARTARKNFLAIEFTFEPVAQGSLAMQFQVDGVNRGPVYTFNPTRRYQNQTISIGDGREVTAVITDRGNPGDDFEILAHAIDFTVGNRDMGRGAV